jgi:hypothetical protein
VNADDIVKCTRFFYKIFYKKRRSPAALLREAGNFVQAFDYVIRFFYKKRHRTAAQRTLSRRFDFVEVLRLDKVLAVRCGSTPLRGRGWVQMESQRMWRKERFFLPSLHLTLLKLIKIEVGCSEESNFIGYRKPDVSRAVLRKCKNF